MSGYAKGAGVVTALVLLTARILTHGYDGLCLALTFAVIGVLVWGPLVDAIDEGTNLARMSDPSPLPHERGRE